MPQKKICDRKNDCIDETDELECNSINYGSDLTLNKHHNSSLETQNKWEEKMIQENKTENEMMVAYIKNCGKLIKRLE